MSAPIDHLSMEEDRRRFAVSSAVESCRGMGAEASTPLILSRAQQIEEYLRTGTVRR